MLFYHSHACTLGSEIRVDKRRQEIGGNQYSKQKGCKSMGVVRAWSHNTSKISSKNLANMTYSSATVVTLNTH